MKTIIATLSLAALLCGCAGTHFTFDQANRVQIGMTDDEVVKIMGKPYLVNAFPEKTEWVYSYADPGGARAVRFSFDLQGSVIATPRIPKSFLSGNTNAPAPLRSPKQP